MLTIFGIQSITAGHTADIFSSNNMVNGLNEDCINVSNESVSYRYMLPLY